MNGPEPRAPFDDLVQEAGRVLDAARAAGIAVRLAGGLAIARICPSASKPPLSRAYHDLDLAIAGHGAHRPLTEVMTRLGYEPEAMFNALNGSTRLMFTDLAKGRHVDVFVDAVRMCHVIEFKDRLELYDETLSPVDLLLTKLQIVQLNDKDVVDILSLLHDQALSNGPRGGIDVDHLARVWGDDWPLWKTSRLTLDKVAERAPSIVPEAGLSRILESITGLRAVLETGRKTLRWRVRARVGERIRWYELPEEVG